ncbi:MAG: FecR domain-containing protein [Pseudoxanthomonas sp.]
MASQADKTQAAVEQAQYWIARMASGAFDADDAERLQAWLAEDDAHLRLLERERATWQALGGLRDAFAQAPNPAVAAMHANGRRHARRPMRRRLLAGVAAVAACLALALWLPSQWLDWQADHRTDAAVSRLTLDDGSQVALDAGSAIAVDYAADRRQVRLLRGAAWFEVAHGDARPFVVQARQGRIRDIGTAFSVQLADDATLARVSSGEVEVQAGAAAPHRLGAGQGAGYRRDGVLFALADTAPDDVAPWRNGEILFDDTPIDQALRELSRYRAHPLWLLGDLSDAGKVTAVFAVDKPDEAIATLVRMGRLQAQNLPGGVLLVRR